MAQQHTARAESARFHVRSILTTSVKDHHRLNAAHSTQFDPVGEVYLGPRPVQHARFNEIETNERKKERKKEREKRRTGYRKVLNDSVEWAGGRRLNRNRVGT